MAPNRQLPQTPELPCLIFGYGSLMSEKALQETVGKDVTHAGKGYLWGWTRIFNKAGLTHQYVNIQPVKAGDAPKAVHGKIFRITTEAQFLLLAKNEPGYDLIDVTDAFLLNGNNHLDAKEQIYAFAHDPATTNQIRESFLEKCMDGMLEHDRNVFMEETIFPDGYRIDHDVKPANKPQATSAPSII